MACPWGSFAAPFGQRGRVFAVEGLSEELSGAPDSLVDLRTGEPEPTFGVDVFVPRNCTVEDLEVELTARHLVVKVAGWGAFRRHWAYTCRSDEASWHLVDVCVEIKQ